MAKYNLMDNEQPEFFDQYFGDKKKKEEAEKKDKKFDPKAEIPPFDSDLSEKIFDDDAISKISKDKEDIPELIPPEESQIAPASEEQSEVLEPTEDSFYEDEISEPISEPPTSDDIYDTESDMSYRQPRLSYKPILIAASIIAAIVAGYFIVSYLFFDETPQQAEEVVESPEEKLLSEQALQKERFLGSINSSNHYFLNYFTALIDMDKPGINYSSLMFYDKSIYFEVFASNRNYLAQFNMQLKNNTQFPKFTIESVSTRPGSKGGVFALYDLEISQSIPTAAATATSTSKSPSDWLNTVSQQNDLNVKSRREILSQRENLFDVSRMEFVLTGAVNNLQNLVKQIASENSNFRVHKLLLIPTNQRDIAKSPYQCTLILDFYL